MICVIEIAALSLLRQLGDTVSDLPPGLCVFSVGGARLRFLSGCDALDYRILGAVLGGSSYEQAAEDLHTARNTVVYRMRRLWTSLGFHSGRELIVYLRIHHFEEILTGNPQKTREDGKTEGNP